MLAREMRKLTGLTGKQRDIMLQFLIDHASDEMLIEAQNMLQFMVKVEQGKRTKRHQRRQAFQARRMAEYR